GIVCESTITEDGIPSDLVATKRSKNELQGIPWCFSRQEENGSFEQIFWFSNCSILPDCKNRLGKDITSIGGINWLENIDGILGIVYSSFGFLVLRILLLLNCGFHHILGDLNDSQILDSLLLISR